MRTRSDRGGRGRGSRDARRPRELALLDAMRDWASAPPTEDARTSALLDWVETHVKPTASGVTTSA